MGSSIISGSAGDPWVFWAGIAVAGAGIFPVFAGASWRHRLQGLEDTYEARERKVLQRVGDYLRQASTVAEQPRADRIDERDRIVGDILDHLLLEVFPDVAGLRTVVYEISEDENSMNVLDWTGRSDEPKPFLRGTTRGDKAFELMSSENEHQFIADTSQTGDPSVSERYGTYISAPIRSGTSAYGMITVDALRPGDLDSRDGDLMEILASALAVFFAEAARGKRYYSKDTRGKDQENE